MRRFTISKDLMGKLWAFVNTDEYAKRRIKYEVKYGIDNKLPIFINNSGERIKSRSISNLISKVRLEQREKMKLYFNDHFMI